MSLSYPTLPSTSLNDLFAYFIENDKHKNNGFKHKIT